jgi:hypothetical protein
MKSYFAAFFLLFLWASVAIANENNTGQISGAWIPRNSRPISGAHIYAFNTNSGPPPLLYALDSKSLLERSRRVPDAQSISSNEGKFLLELVEGTYYLLARKNSEGDISGPPKDGELYGLSRGKKGEPVKYVVKRGKVTKIGALRHASVFKSPITKTTTGTIPDTENTAITGMLKALDGTPLFNAIVLVYDNQEIKGKPIYVSQPTGKDGKYIVKIDKEGTYFVAVRVEYGGGRLKTGDISGTYGGKMAEPVVVREMVVTKGIDIQVKKSQFDSRRPE